MGSRQGMRSQTDPRDISRLPLSEWLWEIFVLKEKTSAYAILLYSCCTHWEKTVCWSTQKEQKKDQWRK